MAKITYPEKNIGDQFKSTEANEIKASVNAAYDKLDGIEDGATANDTDENLKNRANHTGSQLATTITEDSAHRFSTDVEKTSWNAKESGDNKVANFTTLNDTLFPTVKAVSDAIALMGSASFMGTAIPSTNPGAQTTPKFWIAVTAGTYTNFGGVVVGANSLAVLAWTGSAWVKTETAIGFSVNQVSSKNIFNKDSVVNDLFINPADGNNISLTGGKISTPIPVTANTQYTLSGHKIPGIGFNLAIRYENSAHVKISWISITSNSNLTFTTPVGCSYIVMSLYRPDKPQDYSLTQIELGSIATSFEGFYEYINKVNDKKLLAEALNTDIGVKTIEEYVTEKGFITSDPNEISLIAFGDSITAQADSWTDSFTVDHTAVVITNMAINGAKIAWREGTVETPTPPVDGHDNNVLWNQIKKWEATSPADPTAIIIALGTNDISQGSTIGTMTDAFAQSEAETTHMTMANALRKALQYLILNYPDTQLFVCTPIQSKTGGRNWSNLSNVSTVLSDVSKRLNVKVIDCFNLSGISDEYEPSGAPGRYLIDGIHPNALGAAKQGELISLEFSKNYIR